LFVPRRGLRVVRLVESGFFEQGAAPPSSHKLYKLERRRLFPGRRQYDGHLLNRRISLSRDLPLLAALQRRRAYLGKREEARLCVPGLRELRGLRNVLTVYEFGTNLLIDVGELQSLHRRAPVRGVRRIGDGHARNLRLQQATPLLRLRVAFCAGRE